MSIRNLAVFALVAAASLNAAAEEVVGFRNRLEAVAACKALVEQDGNQSPNKDELKKNADLCRTVILNAYEVVRTLGSEYVVGGIGIFGGIEGNTPQLLYSSAAGNVNYGVTVWATYDTEKLTPGLRFTPLVQGVAGASLVTASPSPIEFSKGVIVFVGRAKRSIFEFNDFYTGMNVEFASPFSAALTAKNSWQITVLNNNGKGAWAVMGMTTANAGNPAKAIGVREMYSYNYTEDGAGLSVTSAAKYVGSRLGDGYEEVKNKLFKK